MKTAQNRQVGRREETGVLLSTLVVFDVLAKVVGGDSENCWVLRVLEEFDKLPAGLSG